MWTLALLTVTPTFAKATPDPVARAASGDPDAIEAVRERGPEGLAALLETNAPDAVVDAVAAQRGARQSGLYWFTDLERAKAEAERLDKPILSLRMLGDLRDEYSCANSRFFRTVLYTNPDVTDLLREEFVLHWSSERPVPLVTIDFGDGRTVRRTVTGNSAHYVLDEDGRPLDVLPGLYGPTAFQTALHDAVDLHDALQTAPDRDGALAGWHGQRLAAAGQRMQRELKAVRPMRSGPTHEAVVAWLSSPIRVDDESPVAYFAMGMATTKAAIEGPVLARTGPLMIGDDVIAGVDAIEAPEPGMLALGKEVRVGPTAEEWGQIGARWREDLHPSSIARIRQEDPLDWLPRDQRSDAEDAMLARLADLVGTDTARNELRLHAVVHGWFARGDVGSLADLNQRVYAQLFLAPADDPWMGLVDSHLYTGLDSAGVSDG